MVTPSYLLVIAEEFQRQGLHGRATSLRIGILGAEPWSEALRLQIESALGIDALDIYGLSEVMGPGVASECIESKDGPVIWEDHFFPEIIDPQSAAVLPDGELGELVFTSLTKEAFPLIRYRTGDLTRLLASTARSMRRLQKLVGRSDDMLIIRGVNVFPSQFEDLILQVELFAPHYLLEAERTGSLDALIVHVEAAHGVDVGTTGPAAAQLARLVKSYIGISVEVKAQPCGSIVRSAGKAQHVIDRRKSG
jgi:phenylacetate-CoA ligase